MSLPNNHSRIPPADSSKSFWHSEPSALLAGHRSTRDLPSYADIVIIGSGITGASVAHHLLSTNFDDDHEENSTSKGASVLMLEAREVCWGATGRNGGHCLPVAWEHPHDPNIGNFEFANFHAIQQTINQNKIDCEFVVQEGVRGLYSPHHVETVRAAIETLRSQDPGFTGLSFTQDPIELARLRLPTALAAVVTDTAARLWPYKFVAGVLENLLRQTNFRNRRTFNLQTLTPVTSLERTSSTSCQWRVHTPRGIVAAKKIVLATNAYTAALLPPFENLIVPCRGQMSALVPSSGLASTNRLTRSFGFLGDGLDDYLIQRENGKGGHLMFGGGRQMGPSLGTVDDGVVDENVARYLRRRLLQVLGPKVWEFQNGQEESGEGKASVGKDELDAVFEWTGIMGFSRDDLPWVGHVPLSMTPGAQSEAYGHGNEGNLSDESGVFLAGGYTGHGMPNAWLCGKAIAQMVVGDGERAHEGEPGRVPDVYRITKERIQRASEMESVAARDWAEMSRATSISYA